MSTRSVTKTQSATALMQSPAELRVAHEEQLALQQAYQAEFYQLEQGLPAARLAGVEPLAAFEQKMDAVRRNADVAGARAEDFAQKYDQAVQRERDDEIRTRFERAQFETAEFRPKIEAVYDSLKKVLDVLRREKQLDDEITAVNKLIAEHQPQGLGLLPRVEHWRHEAEVPAKRVEIASETRIGAANVDMILTTPRDAVAQPAPRWDVVVTGGLPAFRPAPLYDTFAIPGLKRGDAPLIVSGSDAYPWWPRR